MQQQMKAVGSKEGSIKNQRLIVIGAWCLYEWACASFSIIIITFIFSTYFTEKVAEDKILGTFQWANATSLAAIIIAIISPITGAIADYGGHHKTWLFGCTILAVVSAGLLWFSYPESSYVYFMLGWVVVGTVGYEVAQVFYNSFLPTLAPNKYLGRISGWGWGSGYLGGIAALTIALIVIKSAPGWLNRDLAEQIRICGPFVAIWYLVFSLPFFMVAPPISSPSLPLRQAVRKGMSALGQTLKMLPREKNILIYLISHMVYTDGLNTLFAFGGIYAAGTFGLSFEEVLLLGITMNITAGLGAILLGWVDDYLGSKPTVIISLFLMTLLGVPLLLITHKYAFWAVALLLAIFVGPVQSASRSLMVRLFPSHKITAEMFGLYALSGKITAFMGPWLLGVMTLTFNSQRAGMATVLVFFIVGLLLLLPVKINEKNENA